MKHQALFSSKEKTKKKNIMSSAANLLASSRINDTALKTQTRLHHSKTYVNIFTKFLRQIFSKKYNVCRGKDKNYMHRYNDYLDGSSAAVIF